MNHSGVLFVCLGNICRSPMAEAVFRHKVLGAPHLGSLRIDSCGTGGWHRGESPHVGTQGVLLDRGISFEGIVARQLEQADFERFTVIVPMDKDNESEVRKRAAMWGYNEATIRLLMSFAPGHRSIEVPDPYYTGRFEEVYDMIDAGCEGLIHWLVGSKNPR